MSVLMLATIGGLISALSTSLGALLSLISSRATGSPRWNLSIDFALGLMVSASAFSLIGPAALSSGQSGRSILAAVIAGVIFVFFLRKRVQSFQSSPSMKTSHLLMIWVLMVHNFPEGLASGAALAGLGWKGSLPILTGISLQNVPEGALMVLCLRTLGVGWTAAFLGGIGSGLVEMAGGVASGVLLQTVNNSLPILLGFAGGSMVASVLIELMEGDESAVRRVWSRQFAAGFLLLPLLQLIPF
jgi:ZIP family zinc transporter